MKAFKATKKPATIEAIEWTGDNIDNVMSFLNWRSAEHDEYNGLYILTPEGRMMASIGDYIIKGVRGEFYPCKPDIFHKTYDIETTKVNDKTNQPSRSKPRNKYDREIVPGVYVDIYDVLRAFKTESPAIDHAVKKLLAPGKRGDKSRLIDIGEAFQSIESELNSMSEWSDAYNDLLSDRVSDAFNKADEVLKSLAQSHFDMDNIDK